MRGTYWKTTVEAKSSDSYILEQLAAVAKRRGDWTFQPTI